MPVHAVQSLPDGRVVAGLASGEVVELQSALLSAAAQRGGGTERLRASAAAVGAGVTPVEWRIVGRVRAHRCSPPCDCPPPSPICLPAPTTITARLCHPKSGLHSVPTSPDLLLAQTVGVCHSAAICSLLLCTDVAAEGPLVVSTSADRQLHVWADTSSQLELVESHHLPTAAVEMFSTAEHVHAVTSDGQVGRPTRSTANVPCRPALPTHPGAAVAAPGPDRRESCDEGSRCEGIVHAGAARRGQYCSIGGRCGWAGRRPPWRPTAGKGARGRHHRSSRRFAWLSRHRSCVTSGECLEEQIGDLVARTDR